MGQSLSCAEPVPMSLQFLQAAQIAKGFNSRNGRRDYEESLEREGLVKGGGQILVTNTLPPLACNDLAAGERNWPPNFLFNQATLPLQRACKGLTCVTL